MTYEGEGAFHRVGPSSPNDSIQRQTTVNTKQQQSSFLRGCLTETPNTKQTKYLPKRRVRCRGGYLLKTFLSPSPCPSPAPSPSTLAENEERKTPLSVLPTRLSKTLPRFYNEPPPNPRQQEGENNRTTNSRRHAGRRKRNMIHNMGGCWPHHSFLQGTDGLANRLSFICRAIPAWLRGSL